MARPLLLALLLGVAGVAGVAACSDEQPSGPAVVAGAPAGSVTELHGSVTALRGAARRTLVAGDTVAGDDVIETGVDSRVTIVLAHNQVPFSLGPERTQQVGTSPAWSAAREENGFGKIQHGCSAALRRNGFPASQRNDRPSANQLKSTRAEP